MDKSIATPTAAAQVQNPSLQDPEPIMPLCIPAWGCALIAVKLGHHDVGQDQIRQVHLRLV